MCSSGRIARTRMSLILKSYKNQKKKRCRMPEQLTVPLLILKDLP
jgi:hypothetical protein